MLELKSNQKVRDFFNYFPNYAFKYIIEEVYSNNN